MKKSKYPPLYFGPKKKNCFVCIEHLKFKKMSISLSFLNLFLYIEHVLFFLWIIKRHFWDYNKVMLQFKFFFYKIP